MEMEIVGHKLCLLDNQKADSLEKDYWFKGNSITFKYAWSYLRFGDGFLSSAEWMPMDHSEEREWPDGTHSQCCTAFHSTMSPERWRFIFPPFGWGNLGPEANPGCQASAAGCGQSPGLSGFEGHLWPNIPAKQCISDPTDPRDPVSWARGTQVSGPLFAQCSGEAMDKMAKCHTQSTEGWFSPDATTWVCLFSCWFYENIYFLLPYQRNSMCLP